MPETNWESRKQQQPVRSRWRLRRLRPFAIGGALHLLAAIVAPGGLLIIAVAVASLLFLALLGAAGARIGGAPILKAAIRVTFWGAVAMAVTAGVGALFGAHV